MKNKNMVYNEIVTKCNNNSNYFNNLRSFLMRYDNEIKHAKKNYLNILTELNKIDMLKEQIIKITSNIKFNS